MKDEVERKKSGKELGKIVKKKIDERFNKIVTKCDGVVLKILVPVRNYCEYI